MAEPGTVTLLFTDLVGSTELLQRLGDDDGERVRRILFRLLREAVDAQRGREVKNLGDGLMVAFPSARDAIRCATTMQRAVHRHNQREGSTVLSVRVGVEVGEPVRQEDDYFGTPVVVAKRLCDAARGGQILVSDLVRRLVGTRGDFSFRDAGPVELKGLREPVAAWVVEWDTGERPELPELELTGRPVRPAALPPLVARSSTTPLVDREREMAGLRGSWQRAQDGDTRLVLLAGEPGIGKTRLAAEMSREALEDGGLVLYGRCDEESVVPYQPFVEVLHQLMKTGWVSDVVTPAHRVELARFLPELAERLPRARAQAPDLEADRYQLFAAVAAVLDAASRSRSVLLVLDDLHWASKATLLLLRYLVTSATPSAVLLLGTYRDVELSRSHPLSDLLAALRREKLCDVLRVRGLSADEVTALVETRTGRSLQAEARVLTDALWRGTDGNPFFIVEILRHLDETGRLSMVDGSLPARRPDVFSLDMPEGIRDIIGRRLSRLTETSNVVLASAAVLGREFEFDVLARMTDLAEDALLSAVEEALRARLVVEIDDRSSSTYAFTHALVREALLAELSRARRERLHLRAARALEAVAAGRPDPPVAALAQHYRLAGTAAPPDKALDYSIRAGDAAARALAWEEAAIHWRAGLELLEGLRSEPQQRAELLERLADLMYVAGFDLAQGIDFGERALALYCELGQAESAARMHSRLGRDLSTYFEVMDMPRALDHLRAAEAIVGRSPSSPVLGDIHARRAGAGVWTIRSEEGVVQARRALAIAERNGDEALAAAAAMQLGWHVMGLGSPREGLQLLDGAWETLDRLNHRTLPYNAAIGRGMLSMLLLDPLEAAMWLERELRKPRLAQAPIQRRSLAACLSWARVVSGHPAPRVVVEGEPGGVLFGVTCGPPLEFWTERWESAERVFSLADERARQAGNSLEQWANNRWLGEIHRLRGEYGQAEERLVRAVAIPAASPHRPAELAARIDLALCQGERGAPARAREHLDRAGTLMTPQEDWRGLRGRHALAEAVILAAEGSLPAAAGRFQHALDIFRGHGLPWEEAEASLLWGRALRGAGDWRRADELVDAALAIYRRCGAGSPWSDRALAEGARSTSLPVV